MGLLSITWLHRITLSGIKKIISGYELLTVSQLDMVKKLLVIEVQYAQLHLCSF